MRISSVSPSVPLLVDSYALLTRPPLYHAGCFRAHLHVLGLPPAFNLSRDQTLQLKTLTLTEVRGDGRKLHTIKISAHTIQKSLNQWSLVVSEWLVKTIPTSAHTSSPIFKQQTRRSGRSLTGG